MRLPFGEREREESKTKYAENPFPNERAWKDSGLQKSTPLPGPNPVTDAFLTALLFKKEIQKKKRRTSVRQEESTLSCLDPQSATAPITKKTHGGWLSFLPLSRNVFH